MAETAKTPDSKRTENQANVGIDLPSAAKGGILQRKKAEISKQEVNPADATPANLDPLMLADMKLIKQNLEKLEKDILLLHPHLQERENKEQGTLTYIANLLPRSKAYEEQWRVVSSFVQLDLGKQQTPENKQLPEGIRILNKYSDLIASEIEVGATVKEAIDLVKDKTAEASEKQELDQLSNLVNETISKHGIPNDLDAEVKAIDDGAYTDAHLEKIKSFVSKCYLPLVLAHRANQNFEQMAGVVFSAIREEYSEVLKKHESDSGLQSARSRATKDAEKTVEMIQAQIKKAGGARQYLSEHGLNVTEEQANHYISVQSNAIKAFYTKLSEAEYITSNYGREIKEKIKDPQAREIWENFLGATGKGPDGPVWNDARQKFYTDLGWSTSKLLVAFGVSKVLGNKIAQSVAGRTGLSAESGYIVATDFVATTALFHIGNTFLNEGISEGTNSLKSLGGWANTAGDMLLLAGVSKGLSRLPKEGNYKALGQVLDNGIIKATVMEPLALVTWNRAKSGVIFSSPESPTYFSGRGYSAEFVEAMSAVIVLKGCNGLMKHRQQKALHQSALELLKDPAQVEQLMKENVALTGPGLSPQAVAEYFAIKKPGLLRTLTFRGPSFNATFKAFYEAALENGTVIAKKAAIVRDRPHLQIGEIDPLAQQKSALLELLSDPKKLNAVMKELKSDPFLADLNRGGITGMLNKALQNNRIDGLSQRILDAYTGSQGLPAIPPYVPAAPAVPNSAVPPGSGGANNTTQPGAPTLSSLRGNP